MYDISFIYRIIHILLIPCIWYENQDLVYKKGTQTFVSDLWTFACPYALLVHGWRLPLTGENSPLLLIFVICTCISLIVVKDYMCILKWTHTIHAQNILVPNNDETVSQTIIETSIYRSVCYHWCFKILLLETVRDSYDIIQWHTHIQVYNWSIRTYKQLCNAFKLFKGTYMYYLSVSFI